MMQSPMMRSAVHVAPLCVDKMQQQRNDHLGLEAVERTFRRSSNMFWGEGVEDWSCKVAEKKRVQHLQVEDLQSSKVVVSVRAGSSDQIIPATQRMPPNHEIKAASLLVFQELRNATANLEMREKLAVPEAEWPHAIAELSAQNHIEKAAVLSTCKRMEIYVVALSWNRGFQEVTEWMSKTRGIPVEDLLKHLFILRDNDATQCLFRVSAGLDSLVLGEGQILSQVKQVLKVGQGAVGFGRNLTGLFKQAITAGKQAV